MISVVTHVTKSRLVQRADPDRCYRFILLTPFQRSTKRWLVCIQRGGELVVCVHGGNSAEASSTGWEAHSHVCARGVCECVCLGGCLSAALPDLMNSDFRKQTVQTDGLNLKPRGSEWDGKNAIHSNQVINHLAGGLSNESIGSRDVHMTRRFKWKTNKKNDYLFLFPENWCKKEPIKMTHTHKKTELCGKKASS